VGKLARAQVIARALNEFEGAAPYTPRGGKVHPRGAHALRNINLPATDHPGSKRGLRFLPVITDAAGRQHVDWHAVKTAAAARAGRRWHPATQPESTEGAGRGLGSLERQENYQIQNGGSTFSGPQMRRLLGKSMSRMRSDAPRPQAGPDLSPQRALVVGVLMGRGWVSMAELAGPGNQRRLRKMQAAGLVVSRDGGREWRLAR
jgi:hypothetical protein